MANKRKCRACGKYGDPVEMFIVPLGAFHSFDAMMEYIRCNPEKGRQLSRKAERRDLRQRKKENRSRIELYGGLQQLVNRYVVQVLDKDKPCYTCGNENPVIKYDAGHYIPVGAGGGDPRRFHFMNIHKQCSVKCNQHGSGMRKEYREHMIDDYGLMAVEALEGPQATLKEQFPTHDDIWEAIAAMKALLKQHGVRSNISWR